MNGDETDSQLSQWFSTYGLITAERVLGKYQINLAHHDLLAAINSPHSFYHQLLQIPLKNVLNGIVLQQANDYHVYAQKLFIDYLLSGESSKDEAAQGAMARESIEEERQQLINLGEAFHKLQGKHDFLIATSQAGLIKIVRKIMAAMKTGIISLQTTIKEAGFEHTKNTLHLALNHALAHYKLSEDQPQNTQGDFIENMNEVLKIPLSKELKDNLGSDLANLLQAVFNFPDSHRPFFAEAQNLNEEANSFRTQFYDSIIRVIELIKLLPGYKIDPIQDAINREPLYFDKTIGHN